MTANRDESAGRSTRECPNAQSTAHSSKDSRDSSESSAGGHTGRFAILIKQSRTLAALRTLKWLRIELAGPECVDGYIEAIQVKKPPALHHRQHWATATSELSQTALHNGTSEGNKQTRLHELFMFFFCSCRDFSSPDPIHFIFLQHQHQLPVAYHHHRHQQQTPQRRSPTES